MTVAQIYGSSFFEVFKNISKVFFDQLFSMWYKKYFIEKCLYF